MTVTVTLTLEEFDKVRSILEKKGDATQPTIDLPRLMAKAKSLIDVVGIQKIKEAITSFGVNALTELDEKDYENMYRRLEELE